MREGDRELGTHRALGGVIKVFVLFSCFDWESGSEGPDLDGLCSNLGMSNFDAKV
jgi:hypothetical protein